MPSFVIHVDNASLACSTYEALYEVFGELEDVVTKPGFHEFRTPFGRLRVMDDSNTVCLHQTVSQDEPVDIHISGDRIPKAPFMAIIFATTS